MGSRRSALGQRGEARAAFAEMLELALAETREHSAHVAAALSGIAFAADPAAADRAARLRGAVAQLNSDADVVMNAYLEADELERHFERDSWWCSARRRGSGRRRLAPHGARTGDRLGRSLSGASERVVPAES